MAVGQLEHPARAARRDAGARAGAPRASTGSRLRNDTTRSSSRQPGSSRHAPAGRSRPAITTSAPAGRAGRNSSRSQSSQRRRRSRTCRAAAPGAPGRRARARPVGPERSRELRRERRRRRLDRPQIEQHGLASRQSRGVRENAEQRRLADAAGAGYPEHAERRLRRLECEAEQLELGRSSDESPLRAPRRRSATVEPAGGEVESCAAISDMRAPGTSLTPPAALRQLARAAGCRARGSARCARVTARAASSVPAT